MRFSWASLPFVDVTEIDRRISVLKRVRGHERDRSKRKLVEMDLCYLQREKNRRVLRRELHQHFLKNKNKK